jgi:hypothetical protein
LTHHTIWEMKVINGGASKEVRRTKQWFFQVLWVYRIIGLSRKCQVPPKEKT